MARKIKTVKINNKAYYIKQLHPMSSLIVFKRVLTLAGSTIAEFIEKAMNDGAGLLDMKVENLVKEINFKNAINDLFTSLKDEDELKDTIKVLLECVTCGKGDDEGLTPDSDEIASLNFKQFINLLKDVVTHNFLELLPDAAE